MYSNKKISIGDITPLMLEVLSQNGEVTFTITGISMKPLLQDRVDRVCLRKPNLDKIQKYDVILYVRETGTHVLHRVIEVTPQGLVLMGDNQYQKEKYVQKEQIIGVAKGFYIKNIYVSCENIFYQMYAWVWISILPVRQLLKRMKNKLHRFI